RSPGCFTQRQAARLQCPANQPGPTGGRAQRVCGGGAMGHTLAEKVWHSHVVRQAEGEPDLLYIDLHLVHEVTSPQAFEGLRQTGRTVRRPDLTVATEDHNVPTTLGPVTDPVSRTQLEALTQNCAEFGIVHHRRGRLGQG